MLTWRRLWPYPDCIFTALAYPTIRGVPLRRDGAGAAQTEATSAGIIDNVVTTRYRTYTYTFSILRCGFYMDLFLHLSRPYIPCTIKYGTSHRFVCGFGGNAPVHVSCVNKTESADGRTVAECNLLYRSAIKARRAPWVAVGLTCAHVHSPAQGSLLLSSRFT